MYVFKKLIYKKKKKRKNGPGVKIYAKFSIYKIEKKKEEYAARILTGRQIYK